MDQYLYKPNVVPVYQRIFQVSSLTTSSLQRHQYIQYFVRIVGFKTDLNVKA